MQNKNLKVAVFIMKKNRYLLMLNICLAFPRSWYLKCISQAPVNIAYLQFEVTTQNSLVIQLSEHVFTDCFIKLCIIEQQANATKKKYRQGTS